MGSEDYIKQKLVVADKDDQDDLTFFINPSNLDIGRVTEVGSLGVGK